MIDLLDFLQQVAQLSSALVQISLLIPSQVEIHLIPFNLKFPDLAYQVKCATSNKALAVLQKLTLSQSQFQQVLGQVEVFLVHPWKHLQCLQESVTWVKYQVEIQDLDDVSLGFKDVSLRVSIVAQV